MGIVVLGMHRSGTSATAHLLGEQGFDFGGDLLEGREDNPDGYFEHRNVVETHNEFLRRVGRTWDDPGPWDGEFDSDAAATAREQLAQLFEDCFASRELWVLKDPRLCRLLPLWNAMFDRADVRFAIVHRHPFAVARSLERRDGMHRSRALLLWLRHVIEAERGTRSRRRCYFRFEQLIAEPGVVLPRVLDRLGFSQRVTVAEEATERTLEASWVHHRADDEDRRELARLFPWVDRCHRALGELDRAADDGEALPRLDSVRGEMETADRLFQQGAVVPLTAQLDDCNRDRLGLRESTHEHERYIESLLATLEKRQEQIVAQERALASVVASLSEKDRYAASLQQTLEASQIESDRYVASLQEALGEKDRYAAELVEKLRKLEKRLDS